jgi:hypothetical protein
MTTEKLAEGVRKFDASTFARASTISGVGEKEVERLFHANI